jgi:hypothetical protein
LLFRLRIRALKYIQTLLNRATVLSKLDLVMIQIR